VNIGAKRQWAAMHAELCTEGAENNAHSTLANFLGNSIVPQHLAEQPRAGNDRHGGRTRCSCRLTHTPRIHAASAV
jgi:hypothetical protein